MKSKVFWIICVLVLVYILQLVWVNLVIAFMDVFYNLSSDIQHLFLSVFFAPVMEETMYRYAPLSFAKKYFILVFMALCCLYMICKPYFEDNKTFKK